MSSHPLVHRNTDLHKELHYFDRFWSQPFERRDVNRYHEYFPRPAGMVVGEWTPRYMVDFWTPSLLRQAAPDAKLLIMLRDPIERYRSGLTHNLSRQAPEHPIVVMDAASMGMYHRQLTRLYDHFPMDQILVLQYERCRNQPDAELRRTFDFLGLPEEELSLRVLREDIGKTRKTKPTLSEHTHRALLEMYSEDVAGLAKSVQEIDLALWPNFAHLKR